MTGCTVIAYLYDSMANRRVVKILTDLIAESNNILLEDGSDAKASGYTSIHLSGHRVHRP